MKRMIISMFAAVVAATTTVTAFANTLAWFHFDERDPGTAITSSSVGIVTN